MAVNDELLDQATMIDAILMQKIRNYLDRWEKPTLWMYLDSEGLVTVGCGTQLPTIASGKEIAFFHDGTGKPASDTEKESAWEHLRLGSSAQKKADQKHKFGASHYRAESDLRITIATSSYLRDRHVQADYHALKGLYPNFDTFPENAKLALFDMIYNLGLGRNKTHHHPRSNGLRRYEQMNVAVNKADKADWSTAAGLCVRHGISLERNSRTKELFQSCAAGPAKSETSHSVHG